MTERKYSVAEIDRMRAAIDYQWLWGGRMSELEPSRFEVVNEDGPVSYSGGRCSRSYKEDEKTKCVEEMLRTYMLAGVEPEELE